MKNNIWSAWNIMDTTSGVHKDY